MSTRIDSKPQGPAPEASVDSQIQLLRSRVEAEIKKPAVVMVTSAHAGDGKSSPRVRSLRVSLNPAIARRW